MPELSRRSALRTDRIHTCTHRHRCVSNAGHTSDAQRHTHSSTHLRARVLLPFSADTPAWCGVSLLALHWLGQDDTLHTSTPHSSPLIAATGEQPACAAQLGGQCERRAEMAATLSVKLELRAGAMCGLVYLHKKHIHKTLTMV